MYLLEASSADLLWSRLATSWTPRHGQRRLPVLSIDPGCSSPCQGPTSGSDLGRERHREFPEDVATTRQLNERIRHCRSSQLPQRWHCRLQRVSPPDVLPRHADPARVPDDAVLRDFPGRFRRRGPISTSKRSWQWPSVITWVTSALESRLVEDLKNFLKTFARIQKCHCNQFAQKYSKDANMEISKSKFEARWRFSFFVVGSHFHVLVKARCNPDGGQIDQERIRSNLDKIHSVLETRI